MNSISYGPVPSRRLGRSLGINNIPPKICTYACVYCQLGKTINMQVDRATFYRAEEVARAVTGQVRKGKMSLTSGPTPVSAKREAPYA